MKAVERLMFYVFIVLAVHSGLNFNGSDWNPYIANHMENILLYSLHALNGRFKPCQ